MRWKSGKQLRQVSEIREQLARTELFRGYRSLTVAFSGVVGLTAAVVQATWLPKPTERWGDSRRCGSARRLSIWLSWAWRSGLGHERPLALTRRTTVFAVEQFLPSLVVGGLLTVVIVERASESVWMLPGLWALLFSLGIFASCRLLPRAVSIAGMWYLVAGVWRWRGDKGTPRCRHGSWVSRLDAGNL